MWISTRSWVLAALCAGGCATAKPTERGDAPLLTAADLPPTQQPAPAGGTAETPPPVAPPPVLADARAPGTIRREELLAILDTSPGVFLSHVDAEPVLVKGRFSGWRIARFFPGDARMRGAPILAGDVILRVNGSSLERPEHLADVWKRLREAPELRVEIDRQGVINVWRWAIVDG